MNLASILKKKQQFDIKFKTNLQCRGILNVFLYKQGHNIGKGGYKEHNGQDSLLFMSLS